MTLKTLHSRAARRRARIDTSATGFTLIDTHTDAVIGFVAHDSDYMGGLLILEDKISWLS